METLKSDVESLYKTVSAGKVELRVSHRKKYYDVCQQFSQLSQEDNTLLKDLKSVQERINKLHEAFREVL